MSRYLVTGAAGGMGRTLIRTLISKGNEVWGIDRKEMKPETGFYPHTADLCCINEVEKAFNRIQTETDGFDAIIHMAGIYDLNSLAEMPEEDFVRDFDVNLFAAYRINRVFVSMLNKGGRIIMITSELAPLNPLPFTGIYAITKTALDRYAAALRMELQLLGIRVIVIRPGAVKTEMIPESCRKLEDFCAKTKMYQTNAERFRRIVNRVEARSTGPEKIARIVEKSMKSRYPRLVYRINRNPLLLLLNTLPDRLQLMIVRRILT